MIRREASLGNLLPGGLRWKGLSSDSHADRQHGSSISNPAETSVVDFGGRSMSIAGCDYWAFVPVWLRIPSSLPGYVYAKGKNLQGQKGTSGGRSEGKKAKKSEGADLVCPIDANIQKLTLGPEEPWRLHAFAV